MLFVEYFARLFKNIRFYVLLFSLTLSALIFFWVRVNIPGETLQTIRLTQIYGLLSFTYLYFALLAGPLNYMFKWLPFRAKYVKARRALGVSAFYFGILHSTNAFFFQLGGFEGLFFLSNRYLIAISLSFTALLILAAMALTSFDKVIEKITFNRWKLLHRLVYVAAIFIIIHALMLGTHFQNLSGLIPQIFFVSIGFLLILEALRFDFFISKRLPVLPKAGITTLGTVIFLTFVLFKYITPLSGDQASFGIHAEHIKMAKLASQKEYNVELLQPDQILPGENIDIAFNVSDENQNPVVDYTLIFDKYLHLIITDSTLTHYQHLHPEKKGSSFAISTSFPKAGRYYLYIDFLPSGNVERNKSFIIDIGEPAPGSIDTSVLTPDEDLTKQFDDYFVTLSFPNLSAYLLNRGQQQFSFELKTKEGQFVTTLRPYLSAYGHMVMIKEDTYDYVHVHPDTTPADSFADGGPNVTFTPLPIYGEIKPGVYKVFTQFNPDNNLILTEFVVKVN